MKINLIDLATNEPQTIQVQGDEAWLATIYAAYPCPAGAELTRLSGHFELTRLEGDFVQVRGELSYAPYVHCSRCNQPIQWPLNERLEVYFQPKKPLAFSGERELAAEELDEYYLEDDELDLEVLINEAVVLAIPQRTVRPGEQGGGCGVCAQVDDDDCVYASGEAEQKPDNPFRVLKGLKLDD